MGHEELQGFELVGIHAQLQTIIHPDCPDFVRITRITNQGSQTFAAIIRVFCATTWFERDVTGRLAEIDPSISILFLLVVATTHDQSSTRRNRNAFEMTETEDKLIAAAAIIGESRSPTNGYSTPAAIGTPAAL